MSGLIDHGDIGMPVPVFIDMEAEAESWAAMADYKQLRTYGSAIMKAMGPRASLGLFREIFTAEVQQ